MQESDWVLTLPSHRSAMTPSRPLPMPSPLPEICTWSGPTSIHARRSIASLRLMATWPSQSFVSC